jgi:hypothetical protein
MRLHWRAFAVSMFAAFAFDGSPGYAQVERTAETVRLTLSSQTVWQGEHGWCSFAADIVQGRSELSNRCGGAGPFGTASTRPVAASERRRALTDSETATLRKLYEAAQLFDGGHTGADFSESDLPFQILIARSSAPNRRAVVLVLTGNPTFSSGPRKALFDWLIRERQALTR